MMKSIFLWTLIILGFETSKNDSLKISMNPPDVISPDEMYLHNSEALRNDFYPDTPEEKNDLIQGRAFQTRSLKFFPLIDLTGNTTATVSPTDVIKNWRQRKRDAITSYLKRLGIYQ